MRWHLARLLNDRQKRVLRRAGEGLTQRFVDRFLTYSPEQFRNALRAVGVGPGDTIMVHAATRRTSGFTGSPMDVVDALLEAVGPRGHLAMMSMAYTGTAREYLQEGPPFRVSRSVSKMGLATEVFRRREGTRRSFNAVHPILVSGPEADWFIAGHERVLHSAGPESPFQRFLERDAKILFLDVDFISYTFGHYLEDRFEHGYSGRAYHPEPIETAMLDREGRATPFRTFVFDPHSFDAKSRFHLQIENALRKSNALRTRRVGNSRLMAVRAQDIVVHAEALASSPIEAVSPQN